MKLAKERLQFERGVMKSCVLREASQLHAQQVQQRIDQSASNTPRWQDG